MASQTLKESIERLTAYAVPQRVSTVDGRDERHWVVRVTEIPSDLLPVEDRLDQLARAAVAEARRERGLAEGQAHVPSVTLKIIEPHHLVLSVTTIALEDDDAEEHLLAGSAALAGLKRELEIEDIQGIPLRYWRLLVGP